MSKVLAKVLGKECILVENDVRVRLPPTVSLDGCANPYNSDQFKVFGRQIPLD
jgi:hypothetical protein